MTRLLSLDRIPRPGGPSRPGGPGVRLTTYFPLSRAEETERLLSGVRAKQLLWASLKAAPGPTVAGVDLGRMQARADSQAATLTELHRWAATEAIQPAPAGAPPQSGEG